MNCRSGWLDPQTSLTRTNSSRQHAVLREPRGAHISIVFPKSVGIKQDRKSSHRLFVHVSSEVNAVIFICSELFGRYSFSFGRVRYLYAVFMTMGQQIMGGR